MARPAHDRDHRDDHWIYTWSGRRFWPLDPRPGDVAIEDITASLSHQPRFGGHCRRFYSVAQHCVHVAELLEREDPDAAMYGLLHDAPEAYLIDLPRPIKMAPGFTEYRRAERLIMAAILEALAVPAIPPRALGWADEVLLATEVRDLMHPQSAAEWRFSVPPLGIPLDPWEPEKARRQFLACYDRIRERPPGNAHTTDCLL